MSATASIKNDCFIGFKKSVESIPLPQKFTFPFYYEPHPLCVIAAEELQHHLQNQTVWKHNFGLVEGMDGLLQGKMFGVLVVQNKDNELGYLAAFSGKLADSNDHALFVPPVFNMLTDGSFFRIGEEEINDVTIELERIENNPTYEASKQFLAAEMLQYETELEACKSEIKKGKNDRKSQREKAEKELAEEPLKIVLEELRKQSIKEQYFLKDLMSNWKIRVAEAQQKVDFFSTEITRLKELRKSMSNDLQQRLFQSYEFLNVSAENKSLLDIFQNELNITPPAGAGECAAPKLLQYAFKNNLKPTAMAEFWWGASPASEVRKHKHFYPACKSKCEPILAHMLSGISMDDNPFIGQPDPNITIETVYEDELFVVIDKPAEFLSVPGINVQDSVYTRMKEKYPEASGPMIVHRLDMSTSGLMLLAKTWESYHHLQNQFLKRTIKKRYVALLDGVLEKDEGYINLPLRVDLEDRPRQLVCHEHGKRAQTRYEVIERKNGKTKVYFYPITGRTHQLRVHASHVLGLNSPIVGDDLYGTKTNRLHLHAEMLEFIHPGTGQRMCVHLDAEF